MVDTITQLITRTLELDEAATPGPWNEDNLEWTCLDQRTQALYLPDDTEENFEWITHSRTAAPLLAKECQRLEGELKRWQSSSKLGQRVRIVDKHGDVHCGVTIVNGMIRLDDTSYIGVSEVTELEMLNES